MAKVSKKYRISTSIFSILLWISAITYIVLSIIQRIIDPKYKISDLS